MIKLFKRIMAVIKAKLNKGVTAIENADPIARVKLAIKERKDMIKELERKVAEHGGATKRMKKRIATLEAEIERWTNNAKTAIGNGNDALAEKALERKAEFVAELTPLKTQYATMEKQFQALLAKINEHEKAIKQKERELPTLEARQKAVEVGEQFNDIMADDDGASFDMINDIESGIADRENTLETAEEMSANKNGADLDRQFAEMNSATSVKSELDALKAEVNDSGSTDSSSSSED